jgi:hypothetical protein
VQRESEGPTRMRRREPPYLATAEESWESDGGRDRKTHELKPESAARRAERSRRGATVIG